MDKPRSAKDFLHEYVKRKGISKKRFAESLGLSRNYLGSGESISVENLQKIIRHPDYQDFNHEALLNGEGDVIKLEICLKHAQPSRIAIYETKSIIKLSANLTQQLGL